MEKLDRLVWTAGLAFISHGSRIGIRTNDAACLDRLSAVLPPGAAASACSTVPFLYSLIVGTNDVDARVRRYNLLYAGPTQTARTMDLDEVCRVLREHLHVMVALQSPRRLFVRASVVAHGDGAVILIGEDEARNAVLRGVVERTRATCYSSRYAVFDRGGRVHPYPSTFTRRSRVSVDRGASPSEKTPMPRPDRQGPLPIKLIVHVGRARPSRASTIELTPAQTALALLGRTVASRPRPRFALQMLRRPVLTALALQLRGGRVDEQVSQLVEQLSR